MGEQLFDVIFFGILQAGKKKERVMQNMATLFKTDAAKLAPYFAGGRKVIKGKITAAVAEKYKAALENAGLVIKIEPHVTQSAEATAGTSAQEASQASGNAAKINTSGLSIAPVGVDIIENPIEKPAQKIDDISNISMAEVGADVLEHPVEVIAQKIGDISGFSVAKTGADLNTKPKVEVKADIPDTSELSLDDGSH